MPFTFVWLWVLFLCMHIQSMYIFTSFLRFSLFSDHTCFMLILNEHLIVHTFSAHPFQYISNVLSIPFQYPSLIPFQYLLRYLFNAFGFIFNTFSIPLNTFSIPFQYIFNICSNSILFQYCLNTIFNLFNAPCNNLSIVQNFLRFWLWQIIACY